MVKALFADRPRIEDMFKRVFAGTEHFGKGSDFHNQMEQFYMLLNTDLPALLEAFDSL